MRLQGTLYTDTRANVRNSSSSLLKNLNFVARSAAKSSVYFIQQFYGEWKGVKMVTRHTAVNPFISTMRCWSWYPWANQMASSDLTELYVLLIILNENGHLVNPLPILEQITKFPQSHSYTGQK